MTRSPNVESRRGGYRGGLPAFPIGRLILLRSVSLILQIAIILVIGGTALLLNFVLAVFSKKALPQELLALRLALGAEAVIVVIRIIVDLGRAYHIRNE